MDITAGIYQYIVVVLAFFLAIFTIWQLLRMTQLREKERNLFRQVFEGSRGARLVTDKSGYALLSNALMGKLCQPFGDVSLGSLSKFFEQNCDAFEKFDAVKKDALKGVKNSVVLELKDNNFAKWVQLVAQPVPNWAGYVHWRIDDVSDSQNVENLIKEEREKLLDFTENAPLGFFSLNEKGEFIFVNSNFAKFLEMTPEEILSGVTLQECLFNSVEDSKPYDLFAGAGVKQAGEVKFKTKSGASFNAGVAQTVTVYENGDIRTRAVVTDLTNETQMRIALEKSEDKFERFFREAPLGIVLIENDGAITNYNEAFLNLLEIKPNDIKNTTLYDWISGAQSDNLKSIFAEMETGEEEDAPVEIVLKAGDKEISTYMYVRRSEEGAQFTLHFIDLTDQKNLEEQFAQSQKMQAVGQLAGGVAHDFNNLLTAMIGYCDLLMLRHKPGDPSFADINQIKQNANRAANLVRQLLAFSRQQTLRPRVLDITDTLTELSHLLRRLIGAQIELTVHHDPELGLVKADEGQLEQVLINLAVNARDAIMETIGEDVQQGELHIKTFNFQNKRKVKRGADDMPAGNWVGVEVRDTGCGIDKENLERIFEPFFTTKEIGSGTGLGLATVYGIIRQTGGYIHVESKPGSGTSFFIYLPEHEETEEDAQDVQTSVEDIAKKDLTGSATIMLVEDEDAVRTFSFRALTNKGYEVIEADCGEAAWDIFKDENPDLDLMITDVVMPGMDGPTLAKKVLEDHPNLKIIFVSGYTEDKFKDDFGDNVTFMPKPYTLQQLAAKVKDVLES